MSDSSSDSDSDSSLFNQQLPFARQSQTSVGDEHDGGGGGGGGGSTSLSQTMAETAVGSRSSSSDNNDHPGGGNTTDGVAASGSDSSPSPKKRARGGKLEEGGVDEEAVKRKAKMRIGHIEMIATDKRTLTSPSQLFWYITNKKGGKSKLYYACREADHADQYKGLDLPKLKEGQTCIQYFDYSGGACAMKDYENVRRSKLVPFHGSADGGAVDLTTASWCPDLCAIYEKQLHKELRSKVADAESRAVQIRVHLLFLAMALDHARTQETETRRLTASQKKNVKRSRPTGCMSSNDIDAALADNEATDDNDASSEDDDDADDDDDDSLDPANKKRKTETLRPGDMIEYYSTLAVQGRKEDRQKATILAVDPKGTTVLSLDSGDVLPKDHFIRRVKKIHRGKLVDCDNANYQQIDYFRLSKASVEGFDGSKVHAKEVERVREIVSRKMAELQETAQAEGFAPMDMMIKYKGTNFDDSKAASAGGTSIDLSEDIAAASSKQQKLQQTINCATGAAAASAGGTEDDDRKPSAEAQEEDDDDDDAEKKTDAEDWAFI